MRVPPASEPASGSVSPKPPRARPATRSGSHSLALVLVTDTSIEILDMVYFEYDKAIIKKESYPILDAVAATLQGNPSISLIEIQGHTDERGDDAYNLDLSDRRAHSVRDYLIGKGVDEKRLTAQGYGETQPLDRSHNEAAWAKNRRVAFLIIKRATD